MHNLSISIPKPCHEDWTKMTPEERGRFCSVCSKTVLDFSNKTTNEIQQFIHAHKNENLCGRFRNDQLNQPVAIQIPLQTSYRMLSPIQIFLLAVLIAFGTSLFACTTPQGRTVGEIQVTDTNNLKKKLSGIEELPVVGGISFCEIPEQGIPEKTEEKEILTGKFETEPDTIFKTLPEVDIEASEVPLVCHFTTGIMITEIKVTNTPGTFEPDSSSLNVENKEEEIQTSEDDFNSRMFPNPTNGILNVEIGLEKKNFVTVDLYDPEGRFVNNLYTKQIIQPGLNNLQLNIGSQPPGIYLLKIVAGNKIKTEKVVLE